MQMKYYQVNLTFKYFDISALIFIYSEERTIITFEGIVNNDI